MDITANATLKINKNQFTYKTYSDMLIITCVTATLYFEQVTANMTGPS